MVIVVAGSHWAFWKAVSPDNAFVSVNTCAQSESTCKATDMKCTKGLGTGPSTEGKE